MSPGELVFDRAIRFMHRAAISAAGRTFTYRDLDAAAARVAARLRTVRSDIDGQRVAFLVKPGFEWVAMQWGIWRAGGVAVPLASSHPPAELRHVIEDCTPSILVADGTGPDRMEPLARERRLAFLTVSHLLAPEATFDREGSGPPSAGAADPFTPDGSFDRHARDPLAAGAADRSRTTAAASVDDNAAHGSSPPIDPDAPAMILYTSGTTGRPKGVVSTHASVTAQITTLVEAWGWSAEDRILHVLPLHHVHGIINVLSCALWSGACCEFLPRFDAAPVWDRLASGEITSFMAVPTIYHRLIAAWDEAPPATRERWSAGIRRLRLMVSGSAALPVRTLERWRAITGHTLLERYGMTEIGMALSNPLNGERRPGTVGVPLPGVEARIVDDAGAVVEPGVAGQIEVRGAQVFHEYWNRPDETNAAFHDGWFVTGDEAVIEDGYWRILGRRSTDIIKSGGYRISALEIEDALREHEAVRDCAVVALPDDDLGERIAAAIVGSQPLEADTLARWARERIAPYKIPREYRFVDDLPRNAMGKVTKPAVRELFRGP